MSLFNKIQQKTFGRSLDNIEWIDDTGYTMIWRFPCYKYKIQNGAQLKVNESQVAVLVNEGCFADVYKPGYYKLQTSNMPILTILKRWKYDFNSPFKADIYFVNTKHFMNIRWGTLSPILMYDREFGPIRMRAFGSYSFRIQSNPVVFIRNIIGTHTSFTNDSVKEQLSNFVIKKFTDYIVKSKIAALDLAANINEFSSELTIALKSDFSDYGIELTKFLIENISLPKAVEEALEKDTRRNVTNDKILYTQMQHADSLNKTSNNTPGDRHLLNNNMSIEQLYNAVGINSHQNTSPSIPKQIMYHVAVDGIQKGPFMQAEMQQMIQKGQLTTNTLVWTQGMLIWKAAGSVASLSQLFDTAPPPL